MLDLNRYTDVFLCTIVHCVITHQPPHLSAAGVMTVDLLTATF